MVILELLSDREEDEFQFADFKPFITIYSNEKRNNNNKNH